MASHTDTAAQAAELLRDGARLLLEAPAELFSDLDRELLQTAPEQLRGDPTLAAQMAASTRANVAHWATYVLRDPAAPVPANLSPEVLGIARDAMRRGAEQMLASAYHAGQNVAWRHFMQLVFALCSDAEVLREALDLASRSISTFIDDTVAALREQLEAERAELTRGTHAERLEVVTLILDGAPLSAASAGARLRYELERMHTAAVLWSDPRSADHAELAAAAAALANAAGARSPLTVTASAASLWAWFAAPTEIDASAARAALAATPSVRAALGRPAGGIEGFRRSHLDAMVTQRLMYRSVSGLALATFEEVQLVALAGADEERAGEFVAATLGDLAGADPELRHTLRTYIRERFSATRAARALFAHRNTVLGRLERAKQLLPVPLEQNPLEVGLALEIAYWLGARA